MIIIHSLEATTSFLTHIIDTIASKFSHEIIILKEDDDPNVILKIVSEKEPSTTIVFLGHGASYCVYSPCTREGKRVALFHKDNLEILRDKHLISLSCRSAEFIHSAKNHLEGSTLLGFGDLPTHWDDVSAIREFDYAAYQGINDEILAEYRNIIVHSFSNALSDTITRNETFEYFYYRMKLYANKALHRVLSENIIPNKSLLANLIYDLKSEMNLIGSPSQKLIS